ncbi:MAG: SNF2-related protein, partial [Nitrososphaera sp.]|nr:SNF2-related protein [Nitrososphaera sp.]
MTVIKIEIEPTGKHATAIGPFPTFFMLRVSSLSGRKQWQSNKAVTFEASMANIKAINAFQEQYDYKVHWIDKGKHLDHINSLAKMKTQDAQVQAPATKYQHKMKLFEHQEKAIALSCNRHSYAYLLEMGLGKTAIALANAGILHLQGLVSGVLVVAPKGVHRQWLEEQLPQHLDGAILTNLILWKNKRPDLKSMNKTGLTFFSMNIDSIRTKVGFEAAEAFLKLHNGKSMMILDESHLIKNGKAQRTRAAWKLGDIASYRRIATGTPIARSIIDAWAQFMFLDENILGHRYMTSFRSHYCIMGGWEGRQIIGQRNVDEFYKMIAPHSFRLTKAEALDLPPKIYTVREYEMDDETRHHYRNVKDTLMTGLDDGTVMDAKNAIVALLRLQQVVCGYLPRNDGTFQTISDDRIQQVLEIVEQVEGPVVIWA